MNIDLIVRYVRDVLVIVTCVVLLVFAYKIFEAYSTLRSLGDSFGGPVVEEPAFPEPEGEGIPDECWDPGGGMVCAPGGLDGLPGGEGDIPAGEVGEP